MGLQGPIPAEFAHVFPRGAFAAGGFEPVRDFERRRLAGSCRPRTRRRGCRCGWST
jgi:hypothetical protein